MFSTAYSRRCGASVLLVGMLSLNSCGSESTDRGVAAPSGSPAVTSEVAQAVDERVGAAVVEPSNFSGEAVALFGQENVDAAYAEMAQYASATTFRAGLMPKADGRTYEDFASAADRMTPKAAADFRRIVERALAGDPSSASTLQGLSWYGMSGPNAELAVSGPLVVNHQISAPSVSVDRVTDVERLAVSFSQHGDLRITSDGQGWLVPLNKSITFWLVPEPPGSSWTWSIDGFESSWDSGDLAVDTATY